MIIDREKAIPYGLASLVTILVLILVGMDVWTNLPADFKERLKPDPSPAPSREVENFVLFREVPFKDTSVTTGQRYESRFADKPLAQWCYVARNFESGADRKFTLGEKDGEGSVTWHTVTDQTARDLGYSRSDLIAARDKCRFS